MMSDTLNPLWTRLARADSTSFQLLSPKVCVPLLTNNINTHDIVPHHTRSPQLPPSPLLPNKYFFASATRSRIPPISSVQQQHPPSSPSKLEFMSIENLKTFDPFAEADEDTGETKQSQNYIHIRIQRTSNHLEMGGSCQRHAHPKCWLLPPSAALANAAMMEDTEC